MLVKKSRTFRFLVFFIINFGALALGGLLQGAGPADTWYQQLNVAPWTPPGWVFGAAWFTIMFCFTFYLMFLWELKKPEVKWLFLVQFILNVSWNLFFFSFHDVLIGLVVITGLTLVVLIFLIKYMSTLKLKSLLVLPYALWLLIATSLNTYILINNF